MEQTFVLEVNDNPASAVQTLSASTTLSDEGTHPVPVYRVLGETPQFRLHSLLPGKEYDFVIYAVNAKGRSDPPVVMSKVRVEGDSVEEGGEFFLLVMIFWSGLKWESESDT